MKKSEKNILWFNEIDKDDLTLVGGKGANLGEMTAAGLPIPNGFVVTSRTYYDFLDRNKLKGPIKETLRSVDISSPESFTEASVKIKPLFEKGEMSESVGREIIDAYLKLGRAWRFAKVAVRSSATAEDLPGASFAGQQVTFLGVKGEANVVKRVKDCWASLFEPRAIFYREEKKFDHLKVGMAVPIQEMISSEVSGIMFTIDPISHQKNRIVIGAIYGLGELIVQGMVTADQYIVNTNNLEIISREIAKQDIELIEAESGVKKINVPGKLKLKRKLTDKQIIELARLGRKIHRHYFFPQDIEWALYKNRLYILQTRPVTTIKEKGEEKNSGVIPKSRKVFLKGQPASPGIVSGPTIIIKSPKEIRKVNKGDILITSMTTPDFVPAMKKAVAIVTDRGGPLSHAAIVSRELGIPCVVGTETATKDIKNGLVITVNGSTGEIYKGGLSSGEKVFISSPPKSLSSAVINPMKIKTATKVYLNLAEPELAEEMAARDVDGIGLLRAEFIIANIGIHPKKLIKDGRGGEFVDKLAGDMKKFCRTFYPRPVVYRATDFKTNEYRNLIGGKRFEPEEGNPLLGYRGAFRYVNDPDVFELEIKAIKKVRQEYNNLWLMIPFVHTPEELREVKKIIAANGLTRSQSFKLWLMVELPVNVICLEDFLSVGVDGVSIGSNDLTMLIMGLDRDNEDLAKIFDERHPAVLWALEKTVKTCLKNKVTCSICGQAPSVYPDLVENLISWGITSVSINPDRIEQTRQLIYSAENRLIKAKRQ